MFGRKFFVFLLLAAFDYTVVFFSITSAFFIRYLVENGFSIAASVYILSEKTWFFTVFAAFFIFLQHFLFNTPYLSGRTALFYYPLFMVNTVFFAKELHLFVVSRYVALPVYASAAIFNCWLFVGLMNISYTMDWKYDADNLKLIEYLENRAKTTDKKIELTISWLYEPSLMFYKEKFHLRWLEVHNFSEGEKLNDFVLFQPYESEKMGNKMNDYPTVVPFFTSSSALYIKH